MIRIGPMFAIAALGVLTACGSAASQNDEIVITGGAGTHVIGLYEGPSEHGGGLHPVGDITVTIEDQHGASTALAVTSYEPVRVIVTGPGAGSVRAVYLDGYHRHSVEGIASGARITNYSGGKEFRPETPRGEKPDDFGWGAGNVPSVYKDVSAGNGSGVQRDSIIGNAKAVLGRPVASLTQTYRASAFRIEEPGS